MKQAIQRAKMKAKRLAVKACVGVVGLGVGAITLNHFTGWPTMNDIKNVKNSANRILPLLYARYFISLSPLFIKAKSLLNESRLEAAPTTNILVTLGLAQFQL